MSDFDDDSMHPPVSRLLGVCVQVKKNNVDQAMRTLKKKIIEENLLKDYQKKEFFMPGTMARRKREAEAKRRWQKKLKMSSGEISS